MSSMDALSAWADRLSDRLNPILVKEARQALKSRQFVLTFMLLLFIAWLISALGVLLSGPAIEYGSPGRGFVMAYVYVLEFAVLFIVPFTAFRSMQVERELTTFELLSISTLSPRNIVLGKLGSAIVQTFLFYSAIAPFIAFTSLLQGFDLPSTLFLLIAILVWAIFTSLFSIMLSAVSNGRQWATLNTLGMLGLLFWQTCISFAFASFVMLESMPFDDDEFWWICGAILVAFVGCFYLTQKIAESRLTFESDNRSTGIRVACLFVFLSQWLLAGVYWGYLLWSGLTFDGDLIIALSLASTFFLTVVGVFAGTEPDYLSRRVRREIPKRWLFRWFMTPLLPGGARGFCFYLALIALVGIWSNLVLMNGSHSKLVMMINGALWYSIIYVSYGTAVGRWIQLISPQVKPAHCRVVTVLIAALALLAPLIPPAFGLVQWSYGYSLLDVTNPFSTLSQFERNSNDNLSAVVFVMLAVAAAIGSLLNFVAMAKSFREVLSYQPPRVLEASEVFVAESP